MRSSLLHNLCNDNNVQNQLFLSLYIYHFSTVIDFSSQSTVVLLDTETPGTSREIYSEDAEGEI